jgi:hypothetical protein
VSVKDFNDRTKVIGEVVLETNKISTANVDSNGTVTASWAEIIPMGFANDSPMKGTLYTLYFFGI